MVCINIFPFCPALAVDSKRLLGYTVFVSINDYRTILRRLMKIIDIDLTNTIAIAQLTTVLIIVAFLLAFLVFNKVGQNLKSRKRS